MKYILITHSFQKQLKKFKKYLTELDIAEDLQKFIRMGLGTGETRLKHLTIFTVQMDVVKLRICVYQVNFRYLIAVVGEQDFLPIIIDLKKGKLGKNLSLKANKKTVDAINVALREVMADYLEHTEEKPRLVVYTVK